MLKGIAQAGGDSTPEDYQGIVVALSELSQTLSRAETDTAFTAAVELGAALLHVPVIAVLVKCGSELTINGNAGVDNNPKLAGLIRDVARSALASSKPVIYPDTGRKSPSLNAKLAESDMAAVICVPMHAGDTAIGAIVAVSQKPRVFNEDALRILKVIASHSAIAAWQARVDEVKSISADQQSIIGSAERKIQELSLLNRVSEAMSSTLDLDVLLDIALEQSLAVVEADAGSLMLINEETNKLEIAASRGLAKKFVERTSQDVGESIAGWVAKNGESVLVTDAHIDKRFKMPFFRDQIVCAASVPLKSKGKVIGVLNVNTLQPEKFFDEKDIELLTTVGTQMAIAIENARLYARVNRRTKQLDSLLQISRTITSTLNLDELMHRLSNEICNLFQLDVCIVLLVDENSGRSRFGYGMGLKTRRKYVYYDLASPIAARVKATGRKVVVKDVCASSAFKTDVAQAEGLKSMVCIPLKSEGKIVGVATGFSKEVRVFPKSQKDIMRPLGDLAGVAIHNARVYRQKYRISELLQQRLIPSSIPALEGLEIGHKFLPSREVGGDYYDFIRTKSENIGVVMADVSGNDVDAAEYTTMGKHVLRAYARESASPGEVLVKTNNLICENTSAEIFISLFYGVLDKEKRTLRYANAGCEPPILYRAETGKVERLVTDGMLLGIKSGTSYEECEIGLNPGDVIVLYTDGLTEACMNDQRLGAEAVMDVLAAKAHLSAQGIADRLHDFLLEFVHGRVTDDVAMVVLKVK